MFGGKQRTFQPIDTKLLVDTLFLYLLRFDFHFFQKQGLLENKIHDMGVHQIRTIVKTQQSGKVTPEGIHKDGHPVFSIHLVDRQNISGGITNLYNNNLEQVETLELENFCDTLLIQDDALYHEVTPINTESEVNIGFRDVLIIEFY